MSDPAALRLTLSLPGLPALSVGLSRLRTDIADWTQFWRERFAPFFYDQVQRDFVLEGGNSGASWAPLSPAYGQWKAARFPNAGILVRSGALKASLSGPDAPLAVFRPGATSLDVGTSVPYGLYHQMGAAGLPQRPPMRLSAAFMPAIGKSLQQWIEARWRERRQQFVSDVQQGIHERVG